jgi:hypothetical protein
MLKTSSLSVFLDIMHALIFVGHISRKSGTAAAEEGEEEDQQGDAHIDIFQSENTYYF